MTSGGCGDSWRRGFCAVLLALPWTVFASTALDQLTTELAQVQAALAVSDDQTAMRHAEAARRLLPQLPPDAHAARADVWTNLGAVHLVRGELAAAQPLLARGLDLARTHAPDSPALLRALNNLGYLQRDRGALREAHGLLAEARELASRLDVDARLRGMIGHNLAQVDYARGDFASARAGFSAGVRQFEALDPAGPQLGAALLGLATSALRAGDVAAAEAAEARAAEIFDAVADDCHCSAMPLLELGLAALRRDQYPLASARLERSYALQQALTPDSGLYLAAIQRGRAALALRQGELDAAQRYADQALKLELAEPQSGLTRVASWHLLGRIADARGRTDAAHRAWCAGMDALERIDLPYAGDPLAQARFHGGHVEVYVGCVHARLKAGQTEAAWRAWQQARARGWREALAQRGLQALKTAPEPAPPDGTLALDYVVGTDRSVLFVRTGRSLIAHELPLAAAMLTARVRAWRALLQRGSDADLGQIRQLAAQLRLDLLGPVAAQILRHRVLAIGADDVLHELPFAALWDAHRQHWLIEDIALEMRDTPVAAASPTAAAVPARLLAVADPAPLGHTALATDPLLRGQLAQWPALPGARREARAVRRHYGEQRSALLLGAPATASRVRAEATQATVLHLAVHGLFDRARPLESALLLAAEPGRPDGLLPAWEVFRDWRLPQARLVVLSACETALGADFGTEGLLSLGRAFKFAGAESVVATLWRIDDGGSVMLMRDLHGEWLNAAAADLALAWRTAVRAQMQRRGETGSTAARGVGGLIGQPSASAAPERRSLHHPYYWAGFVVLR